jgi:MOSC domain-containing protein YiiM
MELGDSQFGENLTTEGLIETEVFIGDRLRIGTAEFIVTEPRMPCYKLGIRCGRKDILRRFLQSRRSGFYLAVTKTGDLAADDDVELLARDENKVSVTDIVRVWVEDKGDVDTMKRALNIGSLPETWKEPFRDRIEKALS